jgi:hypothetical protein
MRKLTFVKTLDLVEDTGGAYKYREVDSSGAQVRRDEDGAIVRDFYLRKSAIPVPVAAPKNISVTIEFEV